MDKKRLEIQNRHDELERLLQDQEVISNSIKLQKLSKEYNELSGVLENFKKLDLLNKSIQESEKIIKEETDFEIKKIAEEELGEQKRKKLELEKDIQEIIEPKNPLGKKDIIVEIRAGTGGEEAALFAAELFRMYSRYAEKRGWKTHLISSNRTGIGGFKEIIFEINGQNVYSDLKYESGVHRVQRVPKTEKSGRVHTSATTVAILPEAEEVDIELKPEDLKIETSTASGHGGQSVNTTYSAIRITHLPTGLVVSCQDERSQQQNRAKALQVLRSRLLAQEEEKRQKQMARERKQQIGKGDRSEKIRTYNFPQDRITDHRLKKNFSNIQAIMDGGLDALVKELKTKF
jgi:peptide chain release factor 1